MRQEAISPPPDQPDLAFFIPSYRAGGAEQSVIRLANWCSQQGLRVDLLVLQDEGPLGERVSADVNQVVLARRRAAFAWLPLRRYLLKTMPRLLVSNMSHLNVLSVLARGIHTDVRLMLVEHRDVTARATIETSRKERFILKLMHWAYPSANGLVAVSRGAARSLEAALELAPGRVSVLPNSVDLDQLKQDAAAPMAHPWLEDENHPLLVSVGRLVELKGFADLLRAFARLREEYDARLIIIGEGLQRAPLEALRDELKLEEVVELPGYLPNPLPLVAGADLFVLSSQTKGQPMELLKALMVGTTIVATDSSSSIRELLVDGKAGLLVPAEDYEMMADAIMRILDDGELRERLREEGMQRGEAFDTNLVGRRFLQLCAKAGVPLEAGKMYD